MFVNLLPQIANLPSSAPELPASAEREGDLELQQFCENAEFPVDQLSTSQRAIVTSIVDTYGQDPGVVGIGSVAVIGAAMGRAFRVEGAVPGQITHGNIMAVVSAMRSEGKGTTAKKLMGPLIEYNSELQRQYRQHERPDLMRELNQAEARLNLLYKAKEEPNPPDEIVRLERRVEELKVQLASAPALYVGSATGAALVQALGRNAEAIMLFCPEAGDAVKVALGRYTKDGGTDIDLMLAGYSVETFSETRVGRGSHHFEQPCVSALWYVQPSLLQEILSAKEAMERGLCARFLFASSPRNVIPLDDGAARSIPSCILSSWHGAVTSVLQRRKGNDVVIACHPDAVEIFLAFHNEIVRLRNGPLRQFQGDFGRARENAIRVALGQAVLDAVGSRETPSMIYPDHAQRGVEIVRYSLAKFAQLLLPLREELRMDRVRKIQEICGGINGRVTWKILKNNHGFQEAELQELVALYPSYLRLETVAPQPQGGRPSRVMVRVG